MPSGPFDAIQSPVRNLHQQAGWPGTVYNHAPADDGSGDWYDDSGGGDDGWIEDDGVSLTIRVEVGTAPNIIRSSGGREITGDATVTVDPTDHPDGKGAFTNGNATDRKATEIVDEDSGDRYRVLRVMDEHNGVLLLDCDLLT
ncbi:hypothetical protein [Halalkalicoccus sp. NIPERK01]|uniref:hypothetical protein n=1 Tax=Halalkalicoccus sp. NIPERK01 TaxID=3053469 RepID=UPI00256F2920|nr:hypothetical protein [Halalkalicoccus sp. NIPERK01]MDL5361353.1 hypothetical protein [Halalkalicoccus sp. NIPERK01]